MIYKRYLASEILRSAAGVVAIGARMPLVAFNVNLDSDNIEIANAIAKKVRHIGGGLRYCKAMGVELKERRITQVSMNMTNYTQTPLYASNQNTYFLHGLAGAGRGLLRADWLANTADPFPLFTLLVCATARFAHEWCFHAFHAAS